MSRSTVSRRAAVTLLGLLAGALIVGATPLSASAHDQVLSTAPASQEHLEVAPTEVSMVFSDAVLDLGATILVVDEAGTDWAQGDVRIAGSAASQGLNGDLPDGRYQVRWRVVSADGHPISGTIPFTVSVGVAPAEDAAPSASASVGFGAAENTEGAAITNSDAGTSDEASQSTAAGSGIPPWAWVLMGLAGVAVVFVSFILFRRKAADLEASSAPRPEEPLADGDDDTPTRV